MEYVRFGELYSIPSSNGVSRPSADRGKGVKMINMGELFSNDIIADMTMERVDLTSKEKQKFLVQNNDLLFARQSLVASGAGKCSIIKELSEETTFESHIIRVRLDKKKCNPWFYYYLFQLSYNPIKAIVNQCAQAGIRGKELMKIKVPFPQIIKQNKIVDILSQYDALIENNNKRIKLLEQMAENIYKEWFVRFRFPGYENCEFENNVPKRWQKSKLRDVAYESGRSITPEKAKNMNHYLPIECLPAHSMVICVEDRIENAASSLQSFKSQNILLGGMRPYFHKIIIAPFDGVTRNTCFVISPYDNDCLYYLYLTMYQKPFIRFATTICVGSTMPYIRCWSDLARFNLIMPPQSILNSFNIIIEPVIRKLLSFYVQNQNLIKQRDLLLPRLMSGKLEV